MISDTQMPITDAGVWMVGDPQATTWICDLGSGAMRLCAQWTAEHQWSATVRGAERLVTVTDIPTLREAQSEAHSQALRMLQDLKDQFEWLERNTRHAVEVS